MMNVNNYVKSIENALIFLAFPLIILVMLLFFPFRYIVTQIEIRKCIKIVKKMNPHECFFKNTGDFLILPNQQIYVLNSHTVKVYSPQNYLKMKYLQKEEFCKIVQPKHKLVLNSLEKSCFSKDVQEDINFCLNSLPILTEKKSFEKLLNQSDVTPAHKRIKI